MTRSRHLFWSLAAGLLLFGALGCNETLVDDQAFFCDEQSDCASDWTCDLSTNECKKVPGGGAECDTFGAVQGCSPGLRCLGGDSEQFLCVPSDCKSDSECPSGEKCFRVTLNYGRCSKLGSIEAGNSCQFSRRELSDPCDEESWCADLTGGIGGGDGSVCLRRCIVSTEAQCDCESVRLNSESGYCPPASTMISP